MYALFLSIHDEFKHVNSIGALVTLFIDKGREFHLWMDSFKDILSLLLLLYHGRQ